MRDVNKSSVRISSDARISKVVPESNGRVISKVASFWNAGVLSWITDVRSRVLMEKNRHTLARRKGVREHKTRQFY